MPGPVPFASARAFPGHGMRVYQDSSSDAPLRPAADVMPLQAVQPTDPAAVMKTKCAQKKDQVVDPAVSVDGDQDEWNTPVAVFEPPNPRVQVMYCRELVYPHADAGGEMSFEELRGAEWLRRNKATLDLRRINENLRRELAERERTWNTREHVLSEQISQQTLQMQQQTLQIQQQMQMFEQLQRRVAELETGGAAGVSGMGRSRGGSSCISAGSSSLHGLSGSITAASPTVNTREALNFVREACDATMDTSNFHKPDQRHARIGGGAAPRFVPFTVHVDTSVVTSGAVGSAAVGPNFIIHQDCGDGKEPDSDKENQPPNAYRTTRQHGETRRQPIVGVLAESAPGGAGDVPSSPLLPPPPPPPPAPAAGRKQTYKQLQLDDELTGFQVRALQMSMIAPDAKAFADGVASRISSTPMVAPITLKQANREEDEDFTANMQSYRPYAGSGVAGGPQMDNGVGGNSELVRQCSTIMECSREDRFKSSSSSSVSDPSRQSQADSHFALTGRPSSMGVGLNGSSTVGHTTAALSSTTGAAVSGCYGRQTPCAADTMRSGYLGDRSSATPAPPSSAAVVMMECMSPCRPPPAAERSTLAESAAHQQNWMHPSAVHEAPMSDVVVSAAPAPSKGLLADLSVSFQPPGDLTMPLPPPMQPGENVSFPPVDGTAEEQAETVVDPWDEELLNKLLENVQLPLAERSCFLPMARQKLPNFASKKVELGEEVWRITLIGEGSYARVYHAIGENTKQTMCLKVQQGDARWEVYVIDELTRRLGASLCSQIMPVSLAFLYGNGTVICTEYQAAGTLLDMRNRCEQSGPVMSDVLPLLFTAEMLGVLETIHAAGVIHGDVKPDNFLIRLDSLVEVLEDLSSRKSSSFPSSHLLQLIDFGRAIDTTLLPAGAVFRRVVATQCFACPEMLSSRAWTYQTDMFGVVATAYLLLFGTYLKLAPPRSASQRWSLPSGDFKRYWKSSLWRQFFDEFLNIPSCGQLPDLASWRLRMLEAASGDSKLRDQLSQLITRLKQK